MLTHSEIRYLLLADVTRYCRARPNFLTGIVLKVTIMGERDFDFLKKTQGNFFTEKASPLPQMRDPFILSRSVKI